MSNHSHMNVTQLERLLTISDFRKETIYGVVGRMKVLLEFFESNPQYRNFIPFLKTYYYVTKASAETYIKKKHFFWSLRDHETLDVYFASLYFVPMLSYLTSGKMVSPWEHYFKYCKEEKGIPFLQLMLGINTHINADLYMAIVHLKYKHQSDFFLVNDILQEVTPDVMRYLVFSEHDPIGLAGTVWKDFTITEFHNIIERWRSEAWANALFTRPGNKKEMEKRVIAKTEKVGGELIADITNLYQLKDIANAAASFQKLSVTAI